MKTGSFLAFVVLLVTGWYAGAGPLDEISHRDKLYDIEVRGDNILVIGYPGLLLYSSDRGSSFEMLEPGTKDALFSIDLNDDGLGAIVGRSGLVLVTTDGGKTWVRKKSGVSEHLFDVEVTDGAKMWAVGHFGTIVHSADGGESWQRQEYDATLPESAGEEGVAISTAEEENQGAAEEARLNAVVFADDSRGWIVGEFGMVLHTADGGASWKRQPSASGMLLFDIIIMSEGRIMVAGSEGALMQSLDDGANWQLIDAGVSEHLLGLCAVGEKLYLVGRDGLILKGGPEGPFERLETRLYTWLEAVDFVDDRVGFVVGGRGYFLKTTDAGKSFTRLSGK